MPVSSLPSRRVPCALSLELRVKPDTWGHRYPLPHLNFRDPRAEGRCLGCGVTVLQQPEGLGPTASEGAEARQFPSASEARPA